MLKLDNLTKVYSAPGKGVGGGVRGATLDLASGQFLSLLGPSGCGKTTMLRCIAGLETPDAGRIVLGERVLVDGDAGTFVPTEHRNIGMVFQSYAIWPHMSVFDNVAFPLTLGHTPKLDRAGIAEAVGRALAFVDLAGFEERPATRLSGGQQQRVALARALVRQPDLLLLDEPLSNLDASLREEMRNELRGMQQRLGITMVYVTHDQSEALAMSDQIAVLSAGRIVQFGTPDQIYFEPCSDFVARFVGNTNLIPGHADGNVVPGQTATVLLKNGTKLRARVAQAISAGAPVTVSLRQESIRFDDPEGAAENALPATISAVSFLGASTRYDLAAGELSLHAVLPSLPRHAVGQAVRVSFPASDSLVLPAEREAR